MASIAVLIAILALYLIRVSSFADCYKGDRIFLCRSSLSPHTTTTLASTKGAAPASEEVVARKAINDAMAALSNVTLPVGKNYTSVTLNFQASRKEKIIFPNKTIAEKYLNVPVEEYNILNEKIVSRSKDDPSVFFLRLPMESFSSALEYALSTKAYRWMSFYDLLATIKVEPNPSHQLISFISGTFFLTNTTTNPKTSSPSSSSDEQIIEYQMIMSNDSSSGEVKYTAEPVSSSSNRDIPSWFRWTGGKHPPTISKHAISHVDALVRENSLIPWAFQPYFRSRLTWEADDNPVVKGRNFFSRWLSRGDQNNATDDGRIVTLNVEVGASISLTPDTSVGKIMLLGGRLAQRAAETSINAVLGIMLRTNVKAFGNSLVRDYQRRFGMTAEEVAAMDREEAIAREKLTAEISKEILDKIRLDPTKSK